MKKTPTIYLRFNHEVDVEIQGPEKDAKDFLRSEWDWTPFVPARALPRKDEIIGLLTRTLQEANAFILAPAEDVKERVLFDIRRALAEADEVDLATVVKAVKADAP
jgi:hypothetical protein